MWSMFVFRWYVRHWVYGHLPVAVQNMLVARHGRQVYRRRFGRDYEEFARFLEQSERSRPEQLREYQEGRLRLLIRHAYETVPHYRGVMDERGLTPSDIAGIGDLVKLPILRKEDVRALGPRLLSTAVRPRSLRTAATSATSGTPLTIKWDRAIAVANHACYMRLRRWAGVPFGTPYATLQGKPAIPPRQRKPPFWRYNPSWNQIRLSTLHMSEENLPGYLNALREFGTQSIEAYPSACYVIARFLRATDDLLPLKCVISTGEPLLPFQRELIEERFSTKVFDAYGQAERVVFSAECEEHDGHHLYDEYGITEMVSERGEPVPDGTPGLVAGTTLHNFGMPLIRYVCGDVGTRATRACTCGRTLPLLEALTSRQSGILVLPDGRMIPGRNVGWSVRMIEHVREWQVIQERPEELRMLVVTGKPITDVERDRVRHYFLARLGPEVTVHLERVPEIPPSPLGKRTHVISHVPLLLGGSNAAVTKHQS